MIIYPIASSYVCKNLGSAKILVRLGGSSSSRTRLKLWENVGKNKVNFSEQNDILFCCLGYIIHRGPPPGSSFFIRLASQTRWPVKNSWVPESMHEFQWVSFTRFLAEPSLSWEYLGTWLSFSTRIRWNSTYSVEKGFMAFDLNKLDKLNILFSQ